MLQSYSYLWHTPERANRGFTLLVVRSFARDLITAPIARSYLNHCATQYCNVLFVIAGNAERLEVAVPRAMATSLVLLPHAVLYEVCGFLLGSDVTALVCCRGLRGASLVEGGLRRVEVTGVEDPVAVLSLLNKLTSLRGLRCLYVHETELGEEACLALARVVERAGLETLSLWANGLAQVHTHQTYMYSHHHKHTYVAVCTV